jgi:phosphoribosylanthranilate isomerase
MFRVKICGITTVNDALLAAEAGADAIGLNFYAASPRYCPSSQAKAIAGAIGSQVCKVGVFVNASADEIRRAVAEVGLDLVQLHGDEPPEFVRSLRPLGVMRAFRLPGDAASVGSYLEACHRLMCVPRMLLVDAARPGQYGGTGATLDWSAISNDRRPLAGLPLVLAGGLKPENVAEAIATVRPWAVDAASGVEASPGRKSAEKVREFVAAARCAFASLGRRA